MRVTNLSLELIGSNPRTPLPLHSIFSTLDAATNAPLLTLQTGATGIPFTTVFKGNSGNDNTLRVAATLDSSLANFLELGYRAANALYFLQPSSTSSSASIPNLLISSGGTTTASLLLETGGQVTLASSSASGVVLTGGTAGIKLQGNGAISSSLAASWSGSHTFTGPQLTITNATAGSGLAIQAATTISKPLQVDATASLSQGLSLTGNNTFSAGPNVNTSLGGTLNVASGVTFQNSFTLLGAATLGSYVSITNDLTVGGKLAVQGVNGLSLTQGGLVAAKGATLGDKLVVTQGGFSVVGDGSITGNTTVTGSLQVNAALLIQGAGGVSISQGPLNVTTGNITTGGSISTATGLNVIANGITSVGPLAQSGGDVTIADGNFRLSVGNLTLPSGSIELSSTTVNAQHLRIAQGYLQVGSYTTVGGLITGQNGLTITNGDTLFAGRLTVQGLQTHLLGALVVDTTTNLGGTLDVTSATTLHANLTVTNNFVINGADGSTSIISTPLNVGGAVVVGSVANKVYLFADGSAARFDTGIQVNNFPLVASAGLNLTGTSAFTVASTVTTSFNGATSFGSSALVTMSGGLSVTSGSTTFSSSSGVSINGGSFTVGSSSSSTFNGSLATNNTVNLNQGATVTGTTISDIFTARTKFQNLSGTFIVDNTGALTSFRIATGAISATAITGSASVTAPTFQNSNASFQVSQSGYLSSTNTVSSPSFTNPAGSFSVDASGNIVANSINVPAISTTSGIYSDYVKANRFLNTNSTFTVDPNGAVVASSVISPTLQNAANSPSYTQDANGNVTLKNLTATGPLTAPSATLSGLVTVGSLQNTANTASLSSNGTVVAKLLQNTLTSPTLFSDAAGNLTVNSLTATTNVTGATANWTSGVTSASYTSASSLTNIDNNGVITTVKLIAPTLAQALTNPTWSIAANGGATFSSGTFTGSLSSSAWSNANASINSSGVLTALTVYAPTLASSSSNPTWSISNGGAATFASATVTNTLSAALLKGTSLQNTNASWTVDSNGNQVALSFANAASAPTFSVTSAGVLTAGASTLSSAMITNTLSAALLKGTAIQNTNGTLTIDNNGNLVTASVIASTWANAASTPTFTVSNLGAITGSALTVTGLVKAGSLSNTNGSWTVSSAGAVNGSSLALTGGVTTGTAGVTIGSVTVVPAAASSAYTLTLPSGLPGTASNLQVSPGGIVSYGSVAATPPTSTYTTPTLPVTTATNVTGLIMTTNYTKAVIQVTTSGGQIARYFLDTYVVSNTWYLTASAQGNTNLGINFQIGSTNAQVTYTMSAAFGTTATFNIIQNP